MPNPIVKVILFGAGNTGFNGTYLRFPTINYDFPDALGFSIFTKDGDQENFQYSIEPDGDDWLAYNPTTDYAYTSTDLIHWEVDEVGGTAPAPTGIVYDSTHKSIVVTDPLFSGLKII